MPKDIIIHPYGLPDILPEDHVYYTFIKKVVRHRCRQSGYRRISTPVFENAKLFELSLGEFSPIIKNNLYAFKQGKETYALRPDLSTGMIRAYIEHDYKKLPQPVEIYAIEQIFKRHPEAKTEEEKLCQFTQFAIEIIGEGDLAMDAQVIYLARKILKDLGIEHRLKLEINNLGCSKCQLKISEDLKNFYFGKKHALCKECDAALDKNPIQLLSCKNEDCEILAKLAPKISGSLCKECNKYYKDLSGFFEELGIEYEHNDLLISDTSSFTHTFFSFIDQELNRPILQGGRQNNLIENLGGTSNPSVGFSCNFEDIVDVMKHENICIKDKDTVDVFVAQLGAEAKKKCMSLMMKLRESGIHAIGALGKGSMKDQLALAEKFSTSWTILIGQIEVLEGIAIIRNMAAGSQEIVRYDDLVDEIIQRLGEDKLDKYSVGVEETVFKGDEEIVGEEYSEMVDE